MCAVPVLTNIRNLLISFSETLDISRKTHRSHDRSFPWVDLLVKVRRNVCTRMKMKVSADIWVPDLAAKEDSRRINATAANDDGFAGQDHGFRTIL